MIPIISVAIGSRRASSTFTRYLWSRDSATGLPTRRQPPRPDPPRHGDPVVPSRPPRLAPSSRGVTQTLIKPVLAHLGPTSARPSGCTPPRAAPDCLPLYYNLPPGGGLTLTLTRSKFRCIRRWLHTRKCRLWGCFGQFCESYGTLKKWAISVDRLPFSRFFIIFPALTFHRCAPFPSLRG